MPWMFGRYGGRHHHGHHGFPGCHRKRFYQNENGAGHKSDGSGEASNEQTKFNYPFQFQQVLEKIWTALGGLPKDQSEP